MNFIPFDPVVHGFQINLGEPIPFHLYDTKKRLLCRAGTQLVQENTRNTLLALVAYCVDPLDVSQTIQRLRQPAKDFFQLWDSIVHALHRDYELLGSYQKSHEADVLYLAMADILEQASLINILINRTPSSQVQSIAYLFLVDSGPYSHTVASIKSALFAMSIAKIACASEFTSKTQLQAYLSQLTLIALLMNSSQIQEHNQARNTEGRLPPALQAKLQEHPHDSFALCQAAAKLGLDQVGYPLVADAVLKHHVSYDAVSYPFTATEVSIPREALIIAVADYFTAKLSGRKARDPITTDEAGRRLFTELDDKVKTPQISDQAREFYKEKRRFATALIKALGQYIPGSIVLIRDKGAAVVVGIGDKSFLPAVVLVTNVERQRLGTPKYYMPVKKSEIESVLTPNELNFSFSIEDLRRIFAQAR